MQGVNWVCSMSTCWHFNFFLKLSGTTNSLHVIFINVYKVIIYAMNFLYYRNMMHISIVAGRSILPLHCFNKLRNGLFWKFYSTNSTKKQILFFMGWVLKLNLVKCHMTWEVIRSDIRMFLYAFINIFLIYLYHHV